MNKKLILLGSLSLIAGSAMEACRLTVTNDTNDTVIFQSYKERKDRLELKPGESKPFGEQVGVENHGEMADLDMTVVGSDNKPIHVKQIKCNEPLYKTHLTVSEIKNKKFVGENEKLFTFDVDKPVMCGG